MLAMGLFRRKAVVPPEPAIDPLTQATMRLDAPTAVVGSVAHADRIRQLLAGRSSARVVAVLEPDVFDTSAADSVGVHVDGHLVGHLPKDDGVRLHAEIESIEQQFGHASVNAELLDGSTPSMVLEPGSSDGTA